MKLLDFQKKGLAEVEHRNRVAFYWDMGTGKTFVGSEKLMSFDNFVNLVVCQKSKVKDWVDHFNTHYTTNAYDLTNKKDYEAFFNDCYLKRIIGVINYDLLIRRSELQTLKDFTLMLDESQAIQNETAKRTKFILKMKPSEVILLSGTPVSGKYEQLYSQCKLLGWNITKKQFWENYINYRLWYPAPMMPPIKIVTGYKNVKDLKLSLRLHGASFLKTEEVMTLPEQVFSTITVPINAQYKTFMKKSIVEVEGKELVGDMAFTKLLYARQLCSIYSKEKLSAFKDWVESTNERLVVFYNFTEELNRMLSVIGDRPVSIVNGEKRDLDAYENESNSITFLQIQSGNSGLNLQKSTRMAFFSLPLSCNMFEQAKKRIHRIGQERTCFYYYFMCEKSVETKILEALKQGKDYTDELFTSGELDL